ncbi:hypothetical protein ACFSX9_03655 [Flavobacterium ardleyense]|uniref:Uncharacterized protein n=1 Tax=Flavobacterium ardleyense TaxID=2038737 RepID=A0ABW5Z4Y5_9FLAO
MTLILENALDFKRFKNVFFLNLILSLLLFGFLFSEESTSKIIIFSLSLICLTLTFLLFSKKGLICNNENVIKIISLFGIIIKIKHFQLYKNSHLNHKKFISSNNYQAHHIFDRTFHVEENFFVLYLNEQNLSTLHSQDKFDQALSFIESNSNLML